MIDEQSGGTTTTLIDLSIEVMSYVKDEDTSNYFQLM